MYGKHVSKALRGEGGTSSEEIQIRVTPNVNLLAEDTDPYEIALAV